MPFALRSYFTNPPITLALLLVVNTNALAGDVTVLAAGAAKELVVRIDAPFTQVTGQRINATFDTVGAQRERVERGGRPDVVILSSAAIAQLNKLGLIDAATLRDVGEVQVGLAVNANSGAPDISTPDALRKALLAAKSIAYADPARGATAGAHFAKSTRSVRHQRTGRGQSHRAAVRRRSD